MAVDEKHKLIVEHEVTNAVTDQDQLTPMAERTKATLGVETLDVVADMGYYDGAEVKKCEAQGMTAYIPQPLTSANTKLGLFGKERFLYDADKDVCRCPAAQELTYRFGTVEKGRSIRYYSTSACGTCTFKPQCTRNKENRRLTRWEYEEVTERMQQRVRQHPELLRKRKMIVEHPFGTIKRSMDQGYFLMRGKDQVRERHLRYMPTKISKSRIKRLRGLSQPQHRLRVGDIRMFYDVTETAVEVLAIVPKAQAQAWLAARGTPSPGGGVGPGKG